jgi:hypothetical protein
MPHILGLYTGRISLADYAVIFKGSYCENSIFANKN